MALGSFLIENSTHFKAKWLSLATALRSDSKNLTLSELVKYISKKFGFPLRDVSMAQQMALTEPKLVEACSWLKRVDLKRLNHYWGEKKVVSFALTKIGDFSTMLTAILAFQRGDLNKIPTTIDEGFQ